MPFVNRSQGKLQSLRKKKASFFINDLFRILQFKSSLFERLNFPNSIRLTKWLSLRDTLAEHTSHNFQADWLDVSSDSTTENESDNLAILESFIRLPKLTTSTGLSVLSDSIILPGFCLNHMPEDWKPHWFPDDFAFSVFWYCQEKLN